MIECVLLFVFIFRLLIEKKYFPRTKMSQLPLSFKENGASVSSRFLFSKNNCCNKKDFEQINIQLE